MCHSCDLSHSCHSCDSETHTQKGDLECVNYASIKLMRRRHRTKELLALRGCCQLRPRQPEHRKRKNIFGKKSSSLRISWNPTENRATRQQNQNPETTFKSKPKATGCKWVRVGLLDTGAWAGGGGRMGEEGHSEAVSRGPKDREEPRYQKVLPGAEKSRRPGRDPAQSQQVWGCLRPEASAGQPPGTLKPNLPGPLLVRGTRTPGQS